jgi:hypothetical protein
MRLIVPNKRIRLCKLDTGHTPKQREQAIIPSSQQVALVFFSNFYTNLNETINNISLCIFS